MSKKAESHAATSWSEADREHQVRVGLDMTPAERLRWLEETIEELQPWLGLAERPPQRSTRSR